MINQQLIQEENVASLKNFYLKNKKECCNLISDDAFKSHEMRIFAQKILLDKLYRTIIQNKQPNIDIILKSFSQHKLEERPDKNGKISSEQLQNKILLNKILLAAANKGNIKAVISLANFGADLKTQNEQKQNVFHLLIEQDPFLSFTITPLSRPDKDIAVINHEFNLSLLKNDSNPHNLQNMYEAFYQTNSNFLSPVSLFIKRLPSPLIANAHPRTHAIYQAKLNSIKALNLLGYNFNTPIDFPMHQPLIIAHLHPIPSNTLIKNLLSAGADYPSSICRSQIYKKASSDIRAIMRQFIRNKQNCSTFNALLYLYGVKKEPYSLLKKEQHKNSFHSHEHSL